ncbi:MAG TPA: hypothetical protein VF550_11765 [Polyangia bacterium]
MLRAPIFGLFIALVLAAPGCRRVRLSPEEQVRKAIDAVVKAVSERNIKPVAAAISAAYSDREGNDKKQIVSLVRVQFLLHPNLYLVTKVTALECPEPIQANVVVYAAMASVPAGVLPDLRNLSADVYRFELTLVDEDGTWRVHRAEWAPATVKDLL